MRERLDLSLLACVTVIPRGSVDNIYFCTALVFSVQLEAAPTSPPPLSRRRAEYKFGK